MERNNSDNDNARSAMEDLIRNRYQDPGVGDSLMGNDELLRRMGRHVESLLCTKNVDEALAVAKEMTFMVAASSTGALYERLVINFKRLLDKVDEAAAPMATLCDSITKIDFISRLPFDIVIHIVDYLWGSISNVEDDTTPTILYVSKYWRKTILESTPFLSCKLPATKLLGHQKTTSASASRIRTMKIRGNVISFSQLLGIHLVNLKHLCIYIPRHRTSCYYRYNAACARGVCTSVRHSYNLDEVMEPCPNLVSLTWSGCVLNGGTAKQHHQLRILQLRDEEDEIDELLIKLPGLVILSIQDVLDVNYLNRVGGYCPSLKCLKYKAPLDIVTGWPYEWDTSLDQGIQEISFDGKYDDDDLTYVIENLLQASKTLRHVHISENIFRYYHEVMPLPEETTFPHLIHFSCDSAYYRDIDELYFDLFLVTIRRSPSIETIQSGYPLFMWDAPEPIDLMALCTRLINASVIMDEYHQDLDALKRFLNTHIEKGTSSTLRLLSISLWSEECANELLPLITQLELLEELHLALSLYSPMALIIDLIYTNNAMKLKPLKITIVEWQVEDPVFGHLQDAHSLKSLVIDADHLSPMAALSLLDLVQLDQLQIPFKGLDNSVIDILSKQFPNMKRVEPHHMWR